MKKIATILALIPLLISSCQKELSVDVVQPPAAEHELTIRFKAIVDNEDLVYGQTYQNSFGEEYSVSAFKFYICKVELINSVTGKRFQIGADEYFLIDFSHTDKSVISMDVEPDEYDRISFMIGVDSIRNVSGAQTGALDPLNGMFWTWNSGYIMAKLEGQSPASPLPNNKFDYHIGGFSGPFKVLNKPVLQFPSAMPVNLEANKRSEFTITANANSWFFNPYDIQIAIAPACIMPGVLAKEISENYSRMFTLTGIVKE